MTVTITPLPTPPNRGMDPETFIAAADTFLAALPLFATQAQAAVDAANLAGPTVTDYARTLFDDADAATARTTLGLAIGSNVQAYHANLAAVAGLNLVADRLIYANGAGTVTLTTFTSFARTLLDDADAATARTTLGCGTAAAKDTGTSGNTVPLLDGANTWSGLQTLSAGANLTPAATPATTAVGYLGTPVNSKSGNYTTVMADAGKDVYYTATATHTIPANASVAYPIGTAYEISADSGATITINITTDTLRWIPGGTTGSRTLTGPGSAVIKKKTATEWWITGIGLS